MVNSEKSVFRDLLVDVMHGYGQAAPTTDMMRTWWKFLEAFSMADVTAAFAKHCENGEFPPRPVDIARMCKNNDGRPSADEAWAIALMAQDESATVVWNDEISAAFFIAKPILDGRDRIGARMAFIKAYDRIVAENRAKGIPRRAFVSLGHDPDARQVAIEAAASAGAITYENPAYAYLGHDEKPDEESLLKIKKHIAELRGILRSDNPVETESQKQMRITEELKAKMQARVDEYKRRSA